MKLLENFAIPIPSEESEIKALYEGIKGLGYKMYNSTYRCYLNSEYIYLCRDVNYVSGGNKNSTYLHRVYPTFEAFKEAHEALNRDGNCSGTEVINFEKIVDKEISKEDNTMARVSSERFKWTKMTQSYTKERTYAPNSINVYIRENPNLNKTEEKTMRRVVTVKLINPNTAIEADMSLVGNFGEYVTDDSNEVLIQEIIMEGDVQDLLDLHNNYLTETVDQSILKATGQEVMLRPIRLKDLKWIIKE